VRKGSSKPLLITSVAAEKVITDACTNWDDWQAVYTHGEPIHTNPLLTSREWFGCFLWEYAVARTVGYHADARASLKTVGKMSPVERAKRLQRELRSNPGFQEALRSGDPEALLQAGRQIAMQYSAKASENGIFSLISKVAALCRPDTFMASDTLARCGLSLLTYQTKTSFDVASGNKGLARFKAYQQAAAELAANRCRWPPESWRRIKSEAEDRHVATVTFALRVIDALAMEIGRSAMTKKS